MMTPTETALFEVAGPRGRRRILIGTVVAVAVLAALAAGAIYRFWLGGQLDARLWEWTANPKAWAFLGRGLAGTVKSAAGAGSIALVAGLAVMFARTSRWRPVRALARIFIEFGRGTPTLLLIYFMFTVPGSFGLQISNYWQVTIPVAIYATAVLAEIYRAGVQAVPRGQKEAAAALGLSTWDTYRHVVLPQAFRIVVPSLVAQLVVVVKDTTFGYVVSYPELMKQAEVLRSTYHSLLPVYLAVGLIYILVNLSLSRLATYLARRNGVRADLGSRP